MSVINSKKDLKKLLGIENIYITADGNGSIVCKTMLNSKKNNFNKYTELITLIKKQARNKKMKIILTNELQVDIFKHPVPSVNLYIRDPLVKKSQKIYKIFNWYLASKPYIVDSILSFVLKSQETIDKYKILCKNIFLDSSSQELCVFHDVTHMAYYNNMPIPYLSNYIYYLIKYCFSNKDKENKIVEYISANETEPADITLRTIPQITYIDYKGMPYNEEHTEKLIKRLIQMGRRNILVRHMDSSVDESIYETDEFITNSIEEHREYYSNILRKSMNNRGIIPHEIEEYFDSFAFIVPFVIWSQP